jgi:ribosome recycling factor
MSSNDFLKNLNLKSQEILAKFKDDLVGIRGGRPTSKLIEDLLVDYCGQKLKIKQLGSISVSSPQEIHVAVWDKSAAAIIAKAIEVSLNVGVNIENNLVRIIFPPLSGERRQELMKLVKKEEEEAKIRLRNLRDEIIKKIKQQEGDGLITEDDKFRLKKDIDRNITQVNQKIEEMVSAKLREINEG